MHKGYRQGTGVAYDFTAILVPDGMTIWWLVAVVVNMQLMYNDDEWDELRDILGDPEVLFLE